MHINFLRKYLWIRGDLRERIFSSIKSDFFTVAAYIDTGISFFKFIGIFAVVFVPDIFAEDSYARFTIPIIIISAFINVFEIVFLVAMLCEQNEAVSAAVSKSI